MDTTKQLLNALDPKYILKQEPFKLEAFKKKYTNKSSRVQNAIKRGIATTAAEESMYEDIAANVYRAAESAVDSLDTLPEILKTNTDTTLASLDATSTASSVATAIEPVEHVSEHMAEAVAEPVEEAVEPVSEPVAESVSEPEQVSTAGNNNPNVTQGGRRKKTRRRKISASTKTRRRS